MEQSNNTTHRTPAANIVDTAVAAGQFGTLVSAIKAAALVQTLSGKGPFTVFAPTDAAFKALPAGALDALLKDDAKLKAVLSYHVLAGRFAARDIKAGELATLQGTGITVTHVGAALSVNGATIKQADIEASNGLIHAIDAVIMPKNWRLLATAA